MYYTIQSGNNVVTIIVWLNPWWIPTCAGMTKKVICVLYH